MCCTCASVVQAVLGSPVFTSITMQTATPILSLEEITPARAESFLKKNKNNRPVKVSNILKLKNDLQQGNFKLTHQGIALDWEGNLLDGQHRLMAIVESGVTASMYVTYNCDPDIFKVIDSGSTRNTNDVLKLLGVTNYSTVASGIRLILWAWDRYAAQSSITPRKIYKTYTTTNAETAEFYTEHAGVLDSLTHQARALRKQNACLMQSSILAFLFLVMEKQKSVIKAHDFIQRVAVGANLQNGSVELALSKFINIRHLDLQGYKKGEFMLMAYIKAFNRYLAGDSLLLFRMGSTDTMPVIMEETDRGW
jgi:hypothetical protein